MQIAAKHRSTAAAVGSQAWAPTSSLGTDWEGIFDYRGKKEGQVGSRTWKELLISVPESDWTAYTCLSTFLAFP